MLQKYLLTVGRTQTVNYIVVFLRKKYVHEYTITSIKKILLKLNEHVRVLNMNCSYFITISIVHISEQAGNRIPGVSAVWSPISRVWEIWTEGTFPRGAPARERGGVQQVHVQTQDWSRLVHCSTTTSIKGKFDKIYDSYL